MPVCVRVCERDREKERGKESLFVCLQMHLYACVRACRLARIDMCVCIGVCLRASCEKDRIKYSIPNKRTKVCSAIVHCHVSFSLCLPLPSSFCLIPSFSFSLSLSCSLDLWLFFCLLPLFCPSLSLPCYTSSISDAHMRTHAEPEFQEFSDKACRRGDQQGQPRQHLSHCGRSEGTDDQWDTTYCQSRGSPSRTSAQSLLDSEGAFACVRARFCVVKRTVVSLR